VVEDRRLRWPVRAREVLGTGRVSSFVEEVVETPGGTTMTRQFLTHPGAVAVVPWDEAGDEIAVLRQYRHPVGMELVEIPAGLLDAPGEDWQLAAARELAEEVELQAGRWDVLVDMVTTPGACEESLRIYLARDLRPAARPEGFVLEGEEAEMTVANVPRAELVDAVLAGRCQSPTLVAGILALETARLSGRLDSLRGTDAKWPIRA
jgi:8-oxo-dGDP phosphatase